MLDIAVKHPQGEDEWVGMCLPTLRPALKCSYKRSNPTNMNKLTNVSEIVLGYYRKSFKEVSKTLAEAASEQWKEGLDSIKKFEQQTPSEDEPHSQGREMAQPADQPRIESFWRTPPTNDTTTTQTVRGASHRKTQFKTSSKDPKTNKKYIPHYKNHPSRTHTSMEDCIHKTPPEGGYYKTLFILFVYFVL